MFIATAFLLATPLPFLHPQSSPTFKFTDKTAEVGLRDSALGSDEFDGFYRTNVWDHHVVGGSLADLDGDGFPELILPAQRNPGDVISPMHPDDQDQGGIIVLLNKESSPGSGIRVFDASPLGLAQIPVQDFDTPLPGTIAHEVQSVIAADFNGDGKLDLLATCGGEPGIPGGPADFALIESPPSSPLQNLLLINTTQPGGSITFVDVTAQTDPDDTVAWDGHGIAYGEDPASFTLWSGTIPGEINPNATAHPSNTLVAAVADVNRDGRLDIYMGNH